MGGLADVRGRWNLRRQVSWRAPIPPWLVPKLGQRGRVRAMWRGRLHREQDYLQMGRIYAVCRGRLKREQDCQHMVRGMLQ